MDIKDSLLLPPDSKTFRHPHLYTNDTKDKTFCEVGANVIFWLWCILAPIIVIGGLISNSVILIVFRYPRFVKTSTMLNMFILAVTECVVLSIGPVHYWTVYVLDYDLTAISDFGCKLNYFVVYVTQDFSSWILVSLTYERVLSVVKPLQVRELLTVRRATFRLVVIFIIMCGVNLHFLFTNGLVKEKGHGFGKGGVICDAMTKEYKYYNRYIFVWINMFVVSLIPFAIMAISHSLLVSSLKKSFKSFPFEKPEITISSFSPHETATSLNQAPSPKCPCFPFAKIKIPTCLQYKSRSHIHPEIESSTPIAMTPNKSVIGTQSVNEETSTSIVAAKSSSMTKTLSIRQSASREVTRTLLLVTTVFFMTTLPNAVYFIAGAFIYNDRTKCTRTNTVMSIVSTSTTLLMYIESGINLYLYLVRSLRFREEVERMLLVIGYRFDRVEPSKLRRKSRRFRHRVL